MVDFSDAKMDPDTGLLCVVKDDYFDSLRKDPILRCDHKQVRQCHFTYVTRFTSAQERVCDENFEKICQIIFHQTAKNETVKKCYTPMEIECDSHEKQEYPLPLYDFSGESNSINGGGGPTLKGFGGGGGGEVCQTLYDSLCTTRYREAAPGKVLGDTKCEKLPRRLCGKPSCRPVPGKEECHDQVVAAVSQVPEETCDLSPQQVCRLETRLVPRLEPLEDCRYRPSQVCRVDLSPPRKDRRPFKVKLCLKEGKAAPPHPVYHPLCARPLHHGRTDRRL